MENLGQYFFYRKVRNVLHIACLRVKWVLKEEKGILHFIASISFVALIVGSDSH
jgi:hypothetical protein